jgi:hypothetical protein
LRFLLFIFMISCGNVDSTVEEVSEVQNSYPVVTTSPEQAPQPSPLMRQAVMCCGDLRFERVVGIFLSLTESLSTNNMDLVSASHLEFIEIVTGQEHRVESLETLLQSSIALDRSSLDNYRAGFGPISDEFINLVRDSSSASGEYDLAVGYSRHSDHHWIQVGVEPKSPYGDGIDSYSWGTREDVLTADAAREIEMGNNQLGGQN